MNNYQFEQFFQLLGIQQSNLGKHMKIPQIFVKASVFSVWPQRRLLRTKDWTVWSYYARNPSFSIFVGKESASKSPSTDVPGERGEGPAMQVSGPRSRA